MQSRRLLFELLHLTGELRAPQWLLTLLPGLLGVILDIQTELMLLRARVLVYVELVLALLQLYLMELLDLLPPLDALRLQPRGGFPHLALWRVVTMV
jgi:hypothetical protein